MEDNNISVMDLKFNLGSGISEVGTRMDTHVKPASVQDGDETVPNSTEGGQEIHSEEIGGGD